MAKLAQPNVASESDIPNFVKKRCWWLKYLNKKTTSNESKHVLVENEFKKLQTFDSNLFIGHSYFPMIEHNFAWHLKHFIIL